jgi:hypothetical protein
MKKVIFALLGVLMFLFVMSGHDSGMAQDKESSGKTIYAYAVGKDAVVILPAGTKFKILASDTIKQKAKVEEEKSAFGPKLIIRGRGVGLKIVDVGGADVTIKYIGAKFDGVEIGRPEGGFKVIGKSPYEPEKK